MDYYLLFNLLWKLAKNLIQNLAPAVSSIFQNHRVAVWDNNIKMDIVLIDWWRGQWIMSACHSIAGKKLKLEAVLNYRIVSALDNKIDAVILIIGSLARWLVNMVTHARCTGSMLFTQTTTKIKDLNQQRSNRPNIRILNFLTHK